MTNRMFSLRRKNKSMITPMFLILEIGCMLSFIRKMKMSMFWGWVNDDVFRLVHFALANGLVYPCVSWKGDNLVEGYDGPNDPISRNSGFL